MQRDLLVLLGQSVSHDTFLLRLSRRGPRSISSLLEFGSVSRELCKMSSTALLGLGETTLLSLVWEWMLWAMAYGELGFDRRDASEGEDRKIAG